MATPDALTMLFGASTILVIGFAMMGLATKVFIHIGEIAATPLYAFILMLEMGMGYPEAKGRFWQLRLDGSPLQRFFMNMFATLALVFAVGISQLLSTDRPFTFLTIPMFMSVPFLSCIAIVYTINWFAPDDKRHPIEKLRSLGVPGTIANWFNQKPQ